MNKWVEGRVVDNVRWADHLYSLIVDAPVDPFTAGQFTKLALDIEGERIARPYSYVNAPQERPLEFYYVIVPNGPLTNYISRLEKGEPIWVASKPQGVLTLERIPEAEHLWFLCTGTAVGPFLSILKTEEPWARFSKIVLAHSVRTVPEQTYQELVHGLDDVHGDQFCVIPFVTREDTELAIKTHIPLAIENGILEQAAGIALHPDSSQVMICGNSDMVRDTRAVLEKQRGFRLNRRSDPGHITVESYF
jgi:ferredoxin--NADP+ reductase